MNFKKTWDDRIERINVSLRYSTGQGFIEEMWQGYKKDYECRCERLKIVAETMGVSVDRAKEIIPWHSYLVSCDSEEFIDKYLYFKEIFGDSLLTLINVDHASMPEHYNGFFSYKNKTLILSKVNDLKDLFELDDDGVIRLLKHSSYYLYYSRQRIEENMQSIANYLCLTFDEARNTCITYPQIIDVSPGLMQSRIDRLCKFFSCKETAIRNMYRIYPPLGILFSFRR